MKKWFNSVQIILVIIFSAPNNRKCTHKRKKVKMLYGYSSVSVVLILTGRKEDLICDLSLGLFAELYMI